MIPTPSHPSQPVVCVESFAIDDDQALIASLEAFIPKVERDPSSRDDVQGFVNLVVLDADSVTGMSVRKERMAINEKLWGCLAAEANFDEVQSAVAAGATLLSALEEQVNVLEVNYEHGACKTAWTSTWSCACDDECSACGTSVQAVDHTEIRVIEQAGSGVWGVKEAACEPEPETKSPTSIKARP